jgi:hypothetical protein
LIGGGVALAGGLLGADASRSAANTQADASKAGTAAQLQMFNTTNAQQAPYRQAGYNSLDALLRGLGIGGGKNYDSSGNVVAAPGSTPAPTREQFTKTIAATPGSLGQVFRQNEIGQTERIGGTPGTPASSSFDQAGYDHAMANWTAQQGVPGSSMQQSGGTGINDGFFTHQFNASDLNSNLAPNYQFMLDQGLGAVKNAGNLQTGLLSGNTLKGVNDYAQNYASNAYQNAFQNYTANQTNIFNRLSNIAGLGQTANQATGDAATKTGLGVAGTLQNAGTAQAGGIVGQANAVTGAANNALGWYTLSQIMNNGGNV